MNKSTGAQQWNYQFQSGVHAAITKKEVDSLILEDINHEDFVVTRTDENLNTIIGEAKLVSKDHWNLAELFYSGTSPGPITQLFLRKDFRFEQDFVFYTSSDINQDLAKYGRFILDKIDASKLKNRIQKTKTDVTALKNSQEHLEMFTYENLVEFTKSIKIYAIELETLTQNIINRLRLLGFPTNRTKFYDFLGSLKDSGYCAGQPISQFEILSSCNITENDNIEVSKIDFIFSDLSQEDRTELDDFLPSFINFNDIEDTSRNELNIDNESKEIEVQFSYIEKQFELENIEKFNIQTYRDMKKKTGINFEEYNKYIEDQIIKMENINEEYDTLLKEYTLFDYYGSFPLFMTYIKNETGHAIEDIKIALTVDGSLLLFSFDDLEEMFIKLDDEIRGLKEEVKKIQVKDYEKYLSSHKSWHHGINLGYLNQHEFLPSILPTLNNSSVEKQIENFEFQDDKKSGIAWMKKVSNYRTSGLSYPIKIIPDPSIDKYPINAKCQITLVFENLKEPIVIDYTIHIEKIESND